jgi:hypothetical protein
MTTKEILQQRYRKSLLNKREVANELGISQSTLDRIRQKGEISSKRVGGGIYFTLDQISQFLDS